MGKVSVTLNENFTKQHVVYEDDHSVRLRNFTDKILNHGVWISTEPNKECFYPKTSIYKVEVDHADTFGANSDINFSNTKLVE